MTMDPFDNPQPPWMDESCAGSLFPQAHPAHPARIVSDGSPHAPLLSEMRAKHDARLARVNAAREREETAEERDARWRAARTKALDDIRRERRLHLPPRDGDVMEFGRFPVRDMTVTINIDPAAIAHLNAQFDKMAQGIRDAFTPMMQQVAQAAQAFGMSATDAAHAMHALQQASLQPWAHDDHQMDSLSQIVANLSAYNTPAEPWQRARRKRADGKVPQRHEQHARDRYLPGTRHSGKGGRW